MQIDLFLFNLILALAVVTFAMWYLRHTTRKIIRELCHTDNAAETVMFASRNVWKRANPPALVRAGTNEAVPGGRQ